jgi:hypothetical protein
MLAVVGLVAAPRAASTPVAAELCSGIASGNIIDIFDTCSDCYFAGVDGRNQGWWTSFSCRGPIRGVYFLHIR